jgi:hypothetical protein
MNYFIALALVLSQFMGINTFAQLTSDPCQKNCILDADCGIGGRCDTGVCLSKTTFCSNELWSTNARGEAQSCGGYKCSETSGFCLTSAQFPDDCTFGYVMDTFRQCVPQVQCSTGDSSCQELMNKWKTAREQYEQTQPPPTANPLTCRACAVHSDCQSQEMCWSGRCSPEGSFCRGQAATGYASFKVTQFQETVSQCGSFSCNPVTGLCLTSCQSDADCALNTRCTQKTCQ